MGHPDFGEVFVCVCRIPAVTRHAQEISGLNEWERQRRLADIETEDRPGTRRMVEICREFLESPVGIVTISGGVGNGKTMALQSVVNELNESGVETLYITAPDLLSHIQDAFDASREAGSPTAEQRRRRFATVAVLAIDEFDKTARTPWAIQELSDLIAKRQRLGEAGAGGTLVAMNRDPAEESEEIASRLMDGRNRVVHNEDADIRPGLAR